MKYEIERTTRFKKDYKLAVKRGANQKLLLQAIKILASGEPLPKVYVIIN